MDTVLSMQPVDAKVWNDAADVNLSQVAKWYCQSSYSNMTRVKSSSILNIYFCGVCATGCSLRSTGAEAATFYVGYLWRGDTHYAAFYGRAVHYHWEKNNVYCFS